MDTLKKAYVPMPPNYVVFSERNKVGDEKQHGKILKLQSHVRPKPVSPYEKGDIQQDNGIGEQEDDHEDDQEDDIDGEDDVTAKELFFVNRSMRSACVFGDLKMLERAISNGGDIAQSATYQRGYSRGTLMHTACYYGHLDIVRELHCRGVSLVYFGDSSENYNTPIHVAASEGYFKIVQFILDHAQKDTGFNVDEINEDNETALYLAVKHGNKYGSVYEKYQNKQDRNYYRCVELLLHAGASWNTLDMLKESPSTPIGALIHRWARAVKIANDIAIEEAKKGGPNAQKFWNAHQVSVILDRDVVHSMYKNVVHMAEEMQQTEETPDSFEDFKVEHVYNLVAGVCVHRGLKFPLYSEYY